MASALKKHLEVVLSDKVITIIDSKRNSGKFLIEFEYDLKDYLVEEILDRCSEDLLTEYSKNVVEEEILRTVCYVLAVTYCVMECKQFRVGHDGTIYINKGYMRLKAEYHVATEISPFLNLSETDMLLSLGKILLHANELDSFISPSELKDMYYLASKAFYEMQKRRLNRLTPVLASTLNMISKIVRASGEHSASTTEMIAIRNLVKEYAESNKNLPIALYYGDTRSIAEVLVCGSKESRCN